MLGEEPTRAFPGQAALSSPAGAARRAAAGTICGLGLLVAVVVALGGCSSVAEVTGTASQQDLLQLRTDVTALQLGLQRTRTDLEKQATQGDTRARQQAQDNQRQTEEV